MPIISKRNAGGRGKDISKINSIQELEQDLKNKFKLAEQEKYQGGFIIQEFVKSSKDYDCRLAIINKKKGFAYGRTLVSHNSNEKWLASASKGSKKIKYKEMVNSRCPFSRAQVSRGRERRRRMV